MKKTISKLFITGTFSLLLSPGFAQTDSIAVNTKSDIKKDTTIADSTKVTEKVVDSTKARPNATTQNKPVASINTTAYYNFTKSNVMANKLLNNRKKVIKEEENTTV